MPNFVALTMQMPKSNNNVILYILFRLWQGVVVLKYLLAPPADDLKFSN